LGEIEFLLSQFRGIKEVVVKVHEFNKNDDRLVAYLNVSEGFNINTKELNRLVNEKLPSYMIPSVYRVMTEFPRTNNGKTDRKALLFDLTDTGKKDNVEL